MKQKITLRLSLIALLAILATTVGITIVYYNLFQKQVKSDLRMNAQLLSDTEVFQNAYAGVPAEYEYLENSAFARLKADNLRITWIYQDGTVLYDNDTDATGLTNHLDRPEIQAAIADGCGESVRRSDTLNLNTFYYALKLDDGTILRVSTQARSITSVFITVAPVIALILAAILFICTVLGHLVVVQLLKPIEMMAEHLDDPLHESVYEELVPFAEKIRLQHENILEAATMRQDFTANISHELKTPLTAISGYAELIENHMIDSDSTEHIARQIRRNAERLLSLINDIIKLSELDHTETNRIFEETDLREAAENCCDNLRMNAAAKNVTIRFAGTKALVKGDRELLREMTGNLIQNAIQYNNEGGFVRVEVGTEGGHAFLKVADNGIGIPKEHQERIFERFYRVDKSRSRETGGTGLGLAIVKHIAEIHGAKIRMESQPGKGTTIEVRF